MLYWNADPKYNHTKLVKLFRVEATCKVVCAVYMQIFSQRLPCLKVSYPWILPWILRTHWLEGEFFSCSRLKRWGVLTLEQGESSWAWSPRESSKREWGKLLKAVDCEEFHHLPKLWGTHQKRQLLHNKCNINTPGQWTPSMICSSEQGAYLGRDVRKMIWWWDLPSL